MYLQKDSNQYYSLFPSAWGQATYVPGRMIVKPRVTRKYWHMSLLKSKHPGEGPCAKGQGWL